MEWHIHEATEWGNGRHTALEAGRGWPLIPCLPVFLWLWASEHTQPIWFNKGRKQTVLEPWETAERGWRRVKLICHMMGCRVWGGGDACRVKRSGNSYRAGKMDVTTADLSAVLHCDFWGKDNILAFHPHPFLTSGQGFVVSFFTAYSVSLRAGYIWCCSTQGLKSGVPAGLLLLQNICPSQTDAPS